MDVSKLVVANDTLNIKDSTARALISSNYTSPFNRLKLGSKGIVYGLTNNVSLAITNSYDNHYYADYTISIPSTVRLSSLGCCFVQTNNGLGLVNADILEQSTSQIKVRVYNTSSATIDMRFEVLMLGDY